jgi:hypothetical protein
MMGCMTDVGVSLVSEGVGDESDRFVGWVPLVDDGVEFDWLTDSRLVSAGEPVVPVELIDAALEQAAAAIDVLAELDATDLDGERLERWAVGVERLRRKIDRAGIAVADHVDTEQPFGGDGFFNARAWLKHRLGLSGPEAFRRVQTARMHRRIPLWANAELSGLVGVAQTGLMAQVTANPRLDDEVVTRDAWGLLNDAIDLPYVEFERNLRMWEMLADPQGAKSKAERLQANRDAKLRPRPDGGWDLTGTLDEIGGVEFNEIFAHFIEAEWNSDWDEARQRLGKDATTKELRRTEAQRRADAMLAMARAAATSGSSGSSPVTVNMLIDQYTFEATVKGDPIDPGRWRDIVCRTDTGRRLHPDDVVNAALWANIRRVVYDTAGVVIDLGRRSRLFTGAAREAVMLLTDKCVWIGCDQPVEWCQADHSLSWSAHGATVPRNGQPMCGCHNRLKERGYHVYRDNNGNWHTIHPDGHEIT